MYLSTPLGNSRCVAVEKSNNLQAKIMQSQIFVFFYGFTSTLSSLCSARKTVNNAEDFEIKKHVFAKGKSRADFTF